MGLAVMMLAHSEDWGILNGVKVGVRVLGL